MPSSVATSYLNWFITWNASGITFTFLLEDPNAIKFTPPFRPCTLTLPCRHTAYTSRLLGGILEKKENQLVSAGFFSHKVMASVGGHDSAASSQQPDASQSAPSTTWAKSSSPFETLRGGRFLRIIRTQCTNHDQLWAPSSFPPRGFYNSSNNSFPTPHSGQTQSSGRSLKSTPAAISCVGSPISGS